MRRHHHARVECAASRRHFADDYCGAGCRNTHNSCRRADNRCGRTDNNHRCGSVNIRERSSGFVLRPRRCTRHLQLDRVRVFKDRRQRHAVFGQSREVAPPGLNPVGGRRAALVAPTCRARRLL